MYNRRPGHLGGRHDGL